MEMESRQDGSRKRIKMIISFHIERRESEKKNERKKKKERK